MKTFCIRVAYEGTRYAGWQVQEGVETIQGCLERAAAAVNGEPSSVLGAGRTDAGVHAEAQGARYRTNRAIEARQVPHALNAHLPDDIRVLGAVEVDAGFHPIRDAQGKHYRYTLRVASFDSPFDRDFVYRIADRLDVDAMKRAAEFLRGTHDFACFQKTGSPRPSTIRTLSRVDVRQSEEYIHLDFEGDGFLYGMARNLAGTLLRIGRGALDPEAIAQGIRSSDRDIAGPCLPAHGLRLVHVSYSFEGEFTA